MEHSRIIAATIKLHTSAEEMENLIKAAIEDRRYKISLEDGRKLRDLLDDAELMINRALRGSLQIPLEESKVIKQCYANK